VIVDEGGITAAARRLRGACSCASHR